MLNPNNMDILVRMALSGDKAAQQELAECYFHGRSGFPQDEGKVSSNTTRQ